MKRIIVKPPNADKLPMVETSYIYLVGVKPNRVIRDKNVHKITKIDPLFILNGFVVITEKDLVQNVIIFGYHPNKDPKTGLYCLPDQKKNVRFSDEYLELLITNLKTYYLDECFYIPSPRFLTYKKMKSIYMQLNQGD